ncbi:hypothetical protein DFQ01_12655 [Paenibacillus cellulosilyticus]|uniref:Cellulose biosynthesis protein BcsQ n=1 Tax=Paenibacillus cellulosilyticus TaxID=375489 RepID=A0A2V2YMD9_9BACL|nr:hypothetical protein [Paenibacillus cellulosilyticus]PWV95584.1 hypothetical protein DFQ01_12655 [Paenibacillus cellulosilyticus]
MTELDAAPLLVFIGTTPNIGTTVAAFAAACRIAQCSDAKVGYLCLNLKSAKLQRYIGVDQPEVGMDHIRPELRDRSLQPNQLLRCTYPVRGIVGLHVLFGNMERDQAEFYTADQMEYLLDTARRTFDVVIADVGAYWDNAATVCAVREASTRVLVTTNALSHFQEDLNRWIGQISPLFGVPSANYELLVIHSPWTMGGFRVKDVRKETGLPLAGELQLTKPLLMQLDSGQYDQWLAGDEGQAVMEQPTQKWMQQYDIQRVRSVHRQPWYRKLLAHRNGVGS